MMFVGRKKELKETIRALSGGKHVFVYGPFGIGKSTFSRAALNHLGLPFLHISLEQTAKKMSEDLAKQITACEYARAIKRRERHVVARGHDRIWDSDSFSALKGRIKLLSTRNRVVLVDNLTKMTHQKLSFLNFLVSQEFSFIVPVDRTAEAGGVQAIRTLCYNHFRINLPNLSTRESLELAGALRSELGIGPNPIQNAAWARQFHGYPLLIVQRIQQDAAGK